MTFQYTLMLLSEISFYFAIISCFIQDIPGVPVISICVFVGAAGHLLDKTYTSWRYLLLPFLLPAFFFVTDMLSFLFVLFPVIYVTLRLISRRYDMVYHDKVSFVSTGLFLSVFLLVVFVILLKREQPLICLALFIPSSICFLRSLRHKNGLITILPVLLVVLIAFCFQTEFILLPFDRIMMFLHEHFVSPITCWFGNLIIKILNRLFSLFHSIGVVSSDFQLFQTDEQIDHSTQDPFVFSIWVNLIKLSLIIIAFIVLVRRIYHVWKYRNKNFMNTENTTAAESATSLPTIPETIKKEIPYPDFIAPRDNRKAVCFYYRKFLQFLKSSGITVSHAYTSYDVHEAAAPAFPEDILTSIRLIYLRARYSTNLITTKDVAEIKTELKKIKQIKRSDRK